MESTKAMLLDICKKPSPSLSFESLSSLASLLSSAVTASCAVWTPVIVDGGITEDIAPLCIKAGVQAMVVGRALLAYTFSAPPTATPRVNQVHNLVARHAICRL